MASGAERGARKRRFADKVAAGVVPAPRVAWRPSDLPTVLRRELDAHRDALANQRHVRGIGLGPPTTRAERADERNTARATTQADVLLAHFSEVT